MTRSLVVQKFGGTSVANAERVLTAARRVLETRRKGHQVVVVVSAPGDRTDELLALAHEVSPSQDERELDMLLATGEQQSIAVMSMALKGLGADAISFTGPQVGIETDTAFNRARIRRVRTDVIEKALRAGRVVIVAGFQGVNADGDITTLGRGGSDLTAVALAAVLKARVCEIFTDVDGVYTTDPRLVPDARKLAHVSYDEMLELASSGAQVMQARSIEVAKKFDVPIHVRSTFNTGRGTMITQEVPRMMEGVVVRGVAFDRHQVKMSMTDVPDRPGVAAKVFGALGAHGINVDMIIQSSARGNVNDISFTIAHGDLKKALGTLRAAQSQLGGSLLYEDGMAKVSIVGVGMRSHAGVAGKMFAALAAARINIEMISTSEIKISCVVKEQAVNRAVRALHKAFGLARADRRVGAGLAPARR